MTDYMQFREWSYDDWIERRNLFAEEWSQMNDGTREAVIELLLTHINHNMIEFQPKELNTLG